MYFKRLITLIVLLALLPSCQRSNTFVLPDSWDGGLLSEEPCGPPCFSGIIPGVTTEAMFANIMQEEAYFQDCTSHDAPNQGRSFQCTGLIVNINDHSIVSAVGFYTSQRILLEDVILRYGQPSAVWVADFGTPEDPEIDMDVFFDEHKIRLDLLGQEGDVYHLEDSAPVTNVVYYSEYNSGLKGFTQEWRGAGDYSVLYTEN